MSKIQERAASGIITVPGGTGFITLYSKFPDKFRTSIDLGAVRSDSGFDGQVGWVRDSAGLRQLIGTELEQLKEANIFNWPILWTEERLKERGITVRFEGKESVGARQAYVISFTMPSKNTYQVFFDVDSYLILKTATKTKALDREILIENFSSDYRQLDGVMLAFRTSRFTNGLPSSEISLQTVKHNSGLDTAIFQPIQEQAEPQADEKKISFIASHSKHYRMFHGNLQFIHSEVILRGPTGRGATIDGAQVTVKGPQGKIIFHQSYFGGALYACFQPVDAQGNLLPPSPTVPAKSTNIFFVPAYVFDKDASVSQIAVAFTGVFDDGERFSESVLIEPESFTQSNIYNLPVKGDSWFVANGSDFFNRRRRTPYFSGNRIFFPDRYALYITRVDGKLRAYRGDGSKNEDYFAWDQPVYAPADGRVVAVVKDMADNKPGRPFAAGLGGNEIVIDHGNGELSHFGHLRHGSITVNKGDLVRAGQQIARIGNSGDSPEPHLRYQLADGLFFLESNSLPVSFSNFAVMMDGNYRLIQRGTLKAGDIFASQ